MVVLNLTNALGFASGYVNGGLARAFPEAFREYRELCGWHRGPKLQERLMGKFQGIALNEGMTLCNAFAQRYLTETRFENDLEAWKGILERVRRQVLAKQRETGRRTTVRVPYRMAAGMQRDEQALFREALEACFADADVEISYRV